MEDSYLGEKSSHDVFVGILMFQEVPLDTIDSVIQNQGQIT